MKKNKKIKIVIFIGILIILIFNLLINYSVSATCKDIPNTKSALDKDSKPIRYSRGEILKSYSSAVNIIENNNTYIADSVFNQIPSLFCAQHLYPYGWKDWSADIRFGCNPSGTYKIKSGESDISDVEMTYMLAMYTGVYVRGDYNQDPLQSIVWTWLGDISLPNTETINSYTANAKEYKEYHDGVQKNLEGSNKIVDTAIKSLSQVGTTVNSSNEYVVGPFQLKEFENIKNENGSNRFELPDKKGFNDFSLITEMQVKVRNEDGVKKDAISVNKIKINNSDKLISDLKPGDTFYIYLDGKDLGEYDELVNISFNYNWIDNYAYGKHYKVDAGYTDENGNYIETDGQDTVLIYGVLDKKKTTCTGTVNVPLKTDMSIYKYVSKVEHADIQEGISTIPTFDGGIKRRNMLLKDKTNDPVKIENGDIVTYTVEIVNNSRFRTRVKVQDILPECYSDLEDPLYTTEEHGKLHILQFVERDENGNVKNEIKNKGIWIQVAPKNGEEAGKRIYEVKLRINAESGKYINKADFITTNDTNTKMQTNYTGSWGNIVNISTKQSDYDTVKIKEYNVGIVKYIYDVEHQVTKNDESLDTTLNTNIEDKNSRISLSENDKKNNPVYVEYGDKITYHLVVYNTINNRKEEPYWEPDLVYVNIEDTLPNNYFGNVEAKILNNGRLTNLSTVLSQDKKTLELKDVVVPASGETIIEITLIVDEYKKETEEANTAKISEITNINKKAIKNHSTKLESSDYYKLNDYNVTLDKYLQEYDEKILEENKDNYFTNESSITNGGVLAISRANKDEMVKEVHPVNVEQGETLKYHIKAINEATNVSKEISSGDKKATQVRTTEIIDFMQQGLKIENVTAMVFDSEGKVVTRYNENGTVNVKVEEKGTEEVKGIIFNKYAFTIGNETILNPGEYIIYTVEVIVEESNMYLGSLENKAELSILTNINHSDTTDYKVTGHSSNTYHNENISEQQESSEFVKMKDLVISGQVWLDLNRDGFLNDESKSEIEMTNNNINKNAMKQGIIVNLYRVGEEQPIRVTKTDENGLYTFARYIDNKDGTLKYYDTYNDTVPFEADKKYQRIDKADSKDGNGNYTANSKYYQYYVEFEYDGLIYKSTEKYAGNSNLNTDGTFKMVKTDEGDEISHYTIDSNAAELTVDRENFNKNYEYISYNVAYDVNMDANTKKELDFQKEGHASYLMEDSLMNDSSRKITAKSFVNLGNQKINYLWLYPFNDKHSIPKTDYLKFINLGLELREDVDLELTKDVYSVKTTINGEEMVYEYNQTDTKKDTKDYIIDKPYGLEIYESDYKYRVDQYFSNAVKAYKGVNGADELNVEVTFKINLRNKATKDDDRVENSNDTKLKVKVHEILDLYDENFMKLQFNEDGSIKDDENDDANKVKIKRKDGNDLLADATLKIGEAWYYDSNGTREDLKLTNKSLYTDKVNDFTEDGYNTVYIRGMDEVVIEEGEDFDIFVKYVVDKEAVETKIQNESFKENISKEIFEESSSDALVSEKITSIKILSETQAIIDRSLKIVDGRDNSGYPFKKENGRGIEGIAQINAYSVWYQDEKPASIIDKDSNAGNLGIKNETSNISPKFTDKYKETTTSADDMIYYEDTVFKTGIEIVASGTENTKEKHSEIFGQVETQLLRDITGKVWDDTRSEVISKNNKETDKDKQYIGNGEYNDVDTKHEEAKSNESLAQNYELGNEDKDLLVRNAKAEFVEIVKVPIKNDDDSIKEYRYYEEVLNGVTWNQVQNTRTKSDGTYCLTGLKPGTYIVRFTYGDTVEDSNIEAKEDMLIFNGQDYKSTKYNTTLSDTENDVDIIIKSLESNEHSDARDDEIRRLQVNSYSEVMTNPIAEVLKGVANGTELTPNSSKNTTEELKQLTDNTYMQAETREFLVKAEKLTATQTAEYSKELNKVIDLLYKDLESFKNSIIASRDFKIENVDLGIEYRPENQVSLMKEISEVKLITEDNTVLVDLHFYSESEGSSKAHHINKEKSTGVELVQFITNNYTNRKLLNDIAAEEFLQGLIYVQIDQEILQGCTVEITYSFDAQNNSEVDRISTNLDKIRYKANGATNELVTKFGADIINQKQYTASETASKVMELKTYKKDADGIKYRVAPKTITNKADNVIDDNGYFGTYTGYTYHNGEIANGFDTIATLKFDKILDYVDTGLKYEGDTSQENVENKLWKKVTSKDLVGYVNTLKESNSGLKDIDGISYESLVVSVDDRNVDGTQTGVKNQDLSRFLEPKVLVTGYVPEDKINTIKIEPEEKRNFTGTISLEVSKILAADTNSEDMTYENMAEIVQFTTLTGRRTNFATTIGNANLHTTSKTENFGSIEFMTAALEADTSATETITLMHPTGLMKNRKAIVNIVETAKTGVEVMSITGLVVLVIALIILIVLFAIRKYKKRRIK